MPENYDHYITKNIKSIAKNEHRFSKLRLYFLSAISPKRKQSAVAADCKITLLI